jgi:hypothetical protein
MGERDPERDHYDEDSLNQAPGRRGRRPSKLIGHEYLRTNLSSAPPLFLVQNLFDSGWMPGKTCTEYAHTNIAPALIIQEMRIARIAQARRPSHSSVFRCNFSNVLVPDICPTRVQTLKMCS